MIHAWLLPLLTGMPHTAWSVSCPVHSSAVLTASPADARHHPPAQVLRKYGLLSEEEVDAMEALGESVGLARLSAAQEEDVLGDVPDEFLDPLLGTVMQARRPLAPSQRTPSHVERCGGHLLHKLFVAGAYRAGMWVLQLV